MSRAQDYANSVSSLYAQIGEARAREAANKGQIWSGALANIGDFVAQYPERKAKMEEIKNRAAMTDLERQKAERQAKQDAKEAEDEQKLTELFATNPNPSVGEIVSRMGPERGIKIASGLKALQATATVDPRVDFEKTQKVLRDVVLGVNALPEGMRAQAYPGIRQHLVERGVIKPEDAPEQYDPAWWQSTMNYGQEPPTPKEPDLVPQPGPNGTTVYGPKIAGAPVVLTPDQAADNARQAAAAQAAAAQRDIENKRAAAMLSLAQQRELRESQNDKEPLVAVMKDGKAVLVRRSQAEGMTPAAGEAGTKELTQAQTLDAGYAHRIDDAEETLKQVESSIAKMGLVKFTAQSHFPAKAQSAEFQQYDQASRNLINAILRRESGAAISQSEFDNAKRQYLPQPGDTKETLKLKEQNRKRQKEALAAGAGRAYTPDTTSSGPKEGDTKPIPGFPGTEQTYRNGKWIRTK